MLTKLKVVLSFLGLSLNVSIAQRVLMPQVCGVLLAFSEALGWRL